MNVLVCDDERQIVDSIIETLEKKTEETQVSSRFYGFSQPSQIDLSLPYDIALLDIDMGETNGIELARKLRAENENIVIIFITNFIQYAPEGFEVQAFRYLLKADLSAKLDSYFDSAVQEVLRRKQLVTISINSEIIDVPVNDILYLESHRRKTPSIPILRQHNGTIRKNRATRFPSYSKKLSCQYALCRNLSIQ